MQYLLTSEEYEDLKHKKLTTQEFVEWKVKIDEAARIFVNDLKLVFPNGIGKSDIQTMRASLKILFSACEEAHRKILDE